jgi:hypothetical protein
MLGVIENIYNIEWKFSYSDLKELGSWNNKKFGTIGQQCALLTVLSTTINLIIRYSLVINFGVSYLIS